MNRSEIEAKLKKVGIKRGSGQRSYEPAKWFICVGSMSSEEYEARIKVISDYLRV